MGTSSGPYVLHQATVTRPVGAAEARLHAGRASSAPAPAPASHSLLVKSVFMTVYFASYFSISMAPYTEMRGTDNSAPPPSWGAH